MSCRLCHVILPSFSRCFAIVYVCCWCFAIVHVCYPTLILNIDVRCDVSSSFLLMFCHPYHAILPCYLLADVSPLHILFEVDVSPLHMLVILLWLPISLLGVMFYHLGYWCLIIFAMLSCYLFADVSPSHMFVADVSPSHVFVILLSFSISLLGVMFYHLNYWCFPIFAWYLAMFGADVSP